jgi:hypothetical protein
MKPSLSSQPRQASAARMFVLFFGGLVLAGLLLIAMLTVLKQKTPPAKTPPQMEKGSAK